jgi:hypothetical protein
MQAFGKPALMSAAWTHLIELVRMVASLIPRELEATITVTNGGLEFYIVPGGPH